MKRIWIVGLSVLGLAMVCRAQKSVPLTTYVDKAHGVSFQYPSVWGPTDSVTYFGFSFQTEKAKLMASFTFDPKGNLYEKTNLMELVFSYFVVASDNLSSCVQQAQQEANASGVPRKVRVNGILFTEISGDSVGMCHGRTSQMDMAWRAGQCFVFERDFDAECAGVDESKRSLTEKEGKALQRHLDEAMQSVRFTP